MSTDVQIPKSIQDELDRLRRENSNFRAKLNKFGLRYKTYPEEGDAQRILRGEIPFLKLNPELSTLKENKTESDTSHVLIEGDNLPVLMSLQATHKGKVDVIYIDPPYNTGNKDFVYNDTFVASDDSFKHSKWLSFMRPRLMLSRELLTSEGVIIVAIDDHEYAPLTMLMDEIYGEQNRLASLIWDGGLKNNSRFISQGHDYMLVYAKNRSTLVNRDIVWRESKKGVEKFLAFADDLQQLDTTQDEKQRLLKKWIRENADSLDKGLKAYSFVDEEGRVYTRGDLSAPGGGGRNYDVFHPLTQKPVKVPSRGWRMSKPSMKELMRKGEISFGKDETTSPRFKRILSSDANTDQVVRSYFWEERSNSNKALQSILGKNVFQFPKDVNVLKRWIKLITRGKKDAIVMDFFAGSGSTGEAVVRLNAEDNGNRQVILVTNNFDEDGVENGIARGITAKRMKRILTGENWADGKAHDPLPGELYYYQTEYRESKEDFNGKDFIGIVALAENAHTVVEPVLDNDAVVLDGQDHFAGLWTDYESLNSYGDKTDDGTLMSEYRINRLNEWVSSQDKDIVWYVDTDSFQSNLISDEETFEEGTRVKSVQPLSVFYMNSFINARNTLISDEALAKLEGNDSEEDNDYEDNES